MKVIRAISRRVVDNANLSWDVGKERKLDLNLFLFNGLENRKMTDKQMRNIRIKQERHLME